MSADLTFTPKMSTQPPPRVIKPSSERMLDLATGLREALRGKLNVVGEIDLVDDGVDTQTIVDCELCTSKSVILLMPKDSVAAAEDYFITPTNGQFTVTHSASASTRTFGVAIFG